MQALRVLTTAILSGSLEVDTHDMLTRYTTDVIATTAFGLRCNSFKDRDNLFYKMGSKANKLSSLAFAKIFIKMLIPFIDKVSLRQVATLG